MNIILETERLVLREFTTEDTPFIIELLNSPGWLEYIGDRNVRTEEEARLYLQNGPLKSYELNGFGLSMVELKDGKIPIGMCGIIKRDNLHGPDIGFALLPAFTGKGYAYEVASATLAYATNQLKLPRVLAIVMPVNKPSIKLLEKIGLKCTGTFSFPGAAEELLLYSNQAGDGQ